MSAAVVRPSALAARDRHRVERHLRRAERSARRATTALDPLRRLVRALLLDELAHYRARGSYPRNVVAPVRQPVFVDPIGTRCAVAHLLDASGEGSLVERIAAARNLAYVDDLADEPRLLAWLRAAGLSLAEAAAIQPGYNFIPSECVCGRWAFGAAPPYGTPATAVLDVQLLATRGADERIASGVVVAVDGAAPGYAVGQTVQVFIANASGAVPQGAIVVVPVGGPTSGYAFNIPDAGHGPAPVDAGADAGPPPPPTDAGPPLLGAYLVQGGAINCTGAIGPLPRAQFVRAVESPTCTATLGALDPRWNSAHDLYGGSSDGGCAVSLGAGGAPSTLGILLALLATRRRRRAAP